MMKTKLNRLLLSSLFLIFMLFSCTVKKSSSYVNKISNTENSTKESPPIMGWASWQTFRVNINEEIIKEQTNAIIDNGLKEFGYDFINIDDGFFGGRNAQGGLIAHPKRFPNGMRTLSDYIHSKGLKAGIYSDAGINTCASYWDRDTIGVGMGMYGFDKQDLTTFLKDWNYDFLKVDWCGGEWLGLDEKKRYTEIAKQARVVRPSVNFNVCRWKFPGKWVTQIANSWRVFGDLDNNFESVLRTIDANADLWPYASYGHYNDMDIFQIGRGMTFDEDKTQFTMWCLMHSPLVLGNDLKKLSNKTKEIITNKELIDINQSKYVYQLRRLIDNGELEVWAKPLVSTMSGQVVVVLLNRTNETQEISFNLASVGINASKEYELKDLWTKTIYPKSQENTISKSVVPHGVVVLKISGESLPYNVFQYKGEPVKR